jgi:hypothetical protein
MNRACCRLLLFANFVLACMPAPATACVIQPIDFLVGNPPRSITDPAEIQEWRRRAEDEAFKTFLAKAVKGQLPSWRQYKARLAAEARVGADRPAGALAEDLMVALVPPLVGQPSSIDSCGTLHVPGPLDPAGYAREPSLGNALLGRRLVSLGVLAGEDQIRELPARKLREFAWDAQCEAEARQLITQVLEERFAHHDLVRSWQLLHRLGYDFNASERGLNRRTLFGALPFRVLAFETGRSGRLVVSPAVQEAGFVRDTDFPLGSISNTQVRRLRERDRAELVEFFSRQPLGRQIVLSIEGVLQDDAQRCPHTLGEMEEAVTWARGELRR